MAEMKALGSESLKTDALQQNPENPRLIFRPDELEDLLLSIKEIGILMPLTVYPDDDGTYRILDGERRWRCAKKLNMQKVPAYIVEKPTRLNNLLMMFNIHGVRQGWDYLPTAQSLKKVMEITGKSGEKELAGLTGLQRGVIRRCKRILSIPEKYQGALLEELKKPRIYQELSEDLFLEVMDAIASIQSKQPDLLKDFKEDEIIEVFVQKKIEGVVRSVTEFRKVGKIAASTQYGVPEAKVRAALRSITTKPSVSIDEVYQDIAGQSYKVADLTKRVIKLADQLESISITNIPKTESKKLIQSLRSLLRTARQILAKLTR